MRTRELAAAVVVVLALAGCTPTAPTYPDPWMPEYDAPWNAMTACWNFVPTERPVVHVRECLTDRNGEMYYEYEPGKYAHGRFYPAGNTVIVCPDLAALEHEFSHAVRWAKTGDAGENGEGRCGL